MSILAFIFFTLSKLSLSNNKVECGTSVEKSAQPSACYRLRRKKIILFLLREQKRRIGSSLLFPFSLIPFSFSSSSLFVHFSFSFSLFLSNSISYVFSFSLSLLFSFCLSFSLSIFLSFSLSLFLSLWVELGLSSSCRNCVLCMWY